MKTEFRKEAYRRFWIVKGHLACDGWSEQEIINMHDSYFKRMWIEGSNGAPLSLYEEGFQEAWEELGYGK